MNGQGNHGVNSIPFKHYWWAQKNLHTTTNYYQFDFFSRHRPLCGHQLCVRIMNVIHSLSGVFLTLISTFDNNESNISKHYVNEIHTMTNFSFDNDLNTKGKGMCRPVS